MPGNASYVYCTLGNAYQKLGSFSQALEYHTQDLTIAKEVGNRAEEGRAYANLGNVYQSQGDFSKAIQYSTQHLAFAKEVGDRAGEGVAYGNLGCAYLSQGDFSKAIQYHTQHLAIAKEVGDRAGEGRAYGNLGCAYQAQRNFSKAIAYHAQDLAIAKEVGNQHLAIAKEVGDRVGEGNAYANLGTCHMYLNEYVKAVAYFEAQHVMATSLKLARVQSTAALNMGVAMLTHLRVRAARQGPATGADQAPGPHSRSSAMRRAWMIECVRRQNGSRLPWMVVSHLQNCT